MSDTCPAGHPRDRYQATRTYQGRKSLYCVACNRQRSAALHVLARQAAAALGMSVRDFRARYGQSKAAIAAALSGATPTHMPLLDPPAEEWQDGNTVLVVCCCGWREIELDPTSARRLAARHRAGAA
jgi:hypothetical protein